MLKVLIPEKIPAHNKGEEAILRGILKTLDFVPINKVYLYSLNPNYDQNIYGEPIETITESLIPDPEKPKLRKLIHILFFIPLHFLFAFIYNINKFLALKLFRNRIWHIYHEVDVVIAGHDSMYAIMHNILILFCKLIKKPIVIYGTSILPFLHKKKWVKLLTRFSLNKTNLITAREKVSYDILLNKIMIENERVYLTGDKAFLVEPISKEKAINLLGRHGIIYGEKKLIGMTAVYKTGIFNTLSYNTEKHIDLMAAFVDVVIKATNSKIVFFPHSIGPGDEDDDRIAARLIYEKCSLKSDIVLIEDDYLVTELKGMIGCCDFLIGERTHSVIGAVSMKVPAIVLSHPDDYRTIGILGEMVGIMDCIFDIRTLEQGGVSEFFLNAWNNREQTQYYLEKRIPEVVENSYKNRTHIKKVLKDSGLFK